MENSSKHVSPQRNPSKVDIRSGATMDAGSSDKLNVRMEGRPDEQNLVVALRVRPMNEDEIIAGATPVAHRVDDNMVVLMDPSDDPDDILRAKRSREKQYVFDVSFDGSSSQKEVYERTTKFLIPSVVNGYNATVFAYGATGAGKTYTMLGTTEEQGIMARTLNDLFLEMDSTKESKAYKVTVSFLEIYNEMIRDLLNPTSGYLELREDVKGVHVSGLSRFQAKSTREVMGILLKGNKERTQEPTAANKTSSRSHAVLQINVRQKNRVRDNTSMEVRLGKLFLIDLAGSERAANTQNRGKRMVEGAHINRSLLALGNCINALSDKNAHKYINFRDSKLTRILKDALGGNCKTVMIATISPASLHFEESRNTLAYADRAKNIKTKVRRNVMDVSYHIAQYTNIIAELREEITRLRTKLDQGTDKPSTIHAVRSGLNENPSEDIEKLKGQLLQAFHDQMKLRRNLMELDNRRMEIGLEEMKSSLLIQKWEREKAITARRRGSADIDLNKLKELDKQKDLEGAELDLPDEVIQAREDITSLQLEEEKLVHRKEAILRDLEISKVKGGKIEERLPGLTSTQDQREILQLLCRIHELEMENVQMQSSCVVRNMEIRQQELTIAQYKQRHLLADELIQHQRALIDENALIVPRDLDELYELYSHQGAALTEISQITLPDISAYKNASLVSFPKAQESHLDLDEASTSSTQLPKIFVPYGGGGANSVARKQLLQKTSQHHSRRQDKERLFAKSPRALHLSDTSPMKGSKSTASLSPPPPNNSLYGNSSARQKSIVTLSTRSEAGETPTPSAAGAPVAEDSEDSGGHGVAVPTKKGEEQRTMISKKTRNIAALAAQRKNHRHVNGQPSGSDNKLAAAAAGPPPSSLDPFFLTQPPGDNRAHAHSQDGGGYLSQSRLAQHNRRYDDATPVRADEIMSTVTDAMTEPALAPAHRKRQTLYRNELIKKSPYAATSTTGPTIGGGPPPGKARSTAGRDTHRPNYQQMTPEEFFKQLSRGPNRKPLEALTSTSSMHSDGRALSKIPAPGHSKTRRTHSEKDVITGSRKSEDSVGGKTGGAKNKNKPLPSIPGYRKGDITVTGQGIN